MVLTWTHPFRKIDPSRFFLFFCFSTDVFYSVFAVADGFLSLLKIGHISSVLLLYSYALQSLGKKTHSTFDSSNNPCILINAYRTQNRWSLAQPNLAPQKGWTKAIKYVYVSSC